MSASVDCKNMVATYNQLYTDSVSMNTTGNTTDSVVASSSFWNPTSTVTYWYPCNCGCSRDRTEKSLKILRSLIETKVVKVTTIRKFLEVLDVITKQLD